MRVLFVENADSFSWNVIDALPVARRQVTLVSGRALGETLSGGAARAKHPGRIGAFDVVVVGPGPTDPERAALMGIVPAVTDARIPLLGICLGFQMLCLAFGARLTRIHPCHGKQTTTVFGASRLPQLGKGLGSGMRNFRDALKGEGGDDDKLDKTPSANGPAADADDDDAKKA